MIPVEHIHPMLVHFPIVFFLSLAVFDIVVAARGKDVTGRSYAGGVSTGIAVLAGLSGVAAFYFGGMALDIAESHGFHSDVAEMHESLGAASAVAFAIWALIRAFLWWRDIRLSGGTSALVPAIEVAGAALVSSTAYYGGMLVYDLGVNVAKAAGAG